jgi:hypothetical protein
MAVRSRPKLCQNVKSPILVEIINRLLLELHSKVGVTINNYALFSQVNEVNFTSEDFFVRFDTASARRSHSWIVLIGQVWVVKQSFRDCQRWAFT